jgi:hypothetical protein
MATLQERINQLSPWHVTTNTTGSKKVLSAPERLPTNDGQIENYRIVWSDDGGETYQVENVKLVAKDGAWHFATWPACINNANRTFRDDLEIKAKEWWQATGKDIYQTRSNSSIIDPDMKLGSVQCSFVTTDTPPKIEIHTWQFLRKGSTWTIAKVT